jgi:hypothetical protein
MKSARSISSTAKSKLPTNATRPRLLIFRPGDRITVKAVTPTRMIFLGGDALKARAISGGIAFLQQGADRGGETGLENGRFAQVPQEHEFIPLPE